MEKFIHISLALGKETREELMQTLPNLHCFQNSLRCNSCSSVFLYECILVQYKHLNNEKTKELATSLAEKYVGYINDGNVNFKLRLTHIGWEDYVMAFKCESDLPGVGPDAQLLVISSYDWHSPKEARSIKHWLELKPIEVDAVLKIAK